MTDSSQDVQIRTVRSFNERCQAWHLVYRKYLESGFIAPHASGLFFGLVDLLPHSTCWVALSGSTVVGTMSMVVNTTSGLPGGAPYEPDLKKLGIDGCVVAEFTKLAVEDSISAANISTDLMAAMICWSMENNIDDIICVVHPRHARTWNHMFGWKPLGEVKSHGGVNNNPGILIHIDLKRSNKSFDNFPPRGQRRLKQAKEHAGNMEISFRPSGCEAATVLTQRAKLFTGSSLAQRFGIERHYPWANHLLRRILDPEPTSLFQSDGLLPERPERDRSIVYPNYASKQRALTGGAINSAASCDQLLFPDAPIAFFLDDGVSDRAPILEAFEESGLIVVHRDYSDATMDVVSQHISDIVLTTLPNDHPELRNVTTFIRNRDAQLDLHTPIVNVSEILGISRFVGANRSPHAVLGRKISFLREFFSIMNLITASNSISTEASIKDDTVGDELLAAVNA